MSVNATFNISATVQGKSFITPTTIEADFGGQFDVACDKAWAGSLTTRTNNTAGTVTASNANHLITTGMLVDLYWGETGSRRGVTVGTVSGTSIPLSDSGVGDNLPVLNTNLTLAPVTSIGIGISGNLALAITVDPNQNGDGTFSLLESSAEVLGRRVTGTDYIWFEGSGVDNPVANSALDTLNVSVNDTTNSTHVIRGSIMYDQA